MKCQNLKCRKQFTPLRNGQGVCSIECARDKAKADREKKQKEEIKHEKRETAKKKREIEPKSYFEKKLQDEVNKIARLIDYGQVCISCQKMPQKAFGCHYKSVGSSPSIRFNLFNIFSGCYGCNNCKGGNVHGYNEGLIQTFGQDFYEYANSLYQATPILQLSKHEIEHKTKIAREIVRELEKDLRVRSAEERLECRKIINERLGIYTNF